MPINPDAWRVKKIAVVGAGIVGVPMAALLASARIRIGGDEPSEVVLIQRDSPTSGWKVESLNAGRSPIGGIEPGLDSMVAETVAAGLLRASSDYNDLADADVLLICVQTDRRNFAPDYGPLSSALKSTAAALRRSSEGHVPLIVIESTLAPSSMLSVVSRQFQRAGLADGRDILLANSPNRVMPGRLLERIASSDKIIGGLLPLSVELARRLYSWIIPEGRLHLCNSMTAEIVKTLENAQRDVRIAYTSEVARFCDAHDLDFYALRAQVNRLLSWEDAAAGNPQAVPVGGMLIPTIGVGGHCLPKDGILLLWRKIESGADPAGSLILEARRVNQESPAEAIQCAERAFGDMSGASIALLGTAYRFDSDDARNTPTLALADRLLAKDCRLVLHDPHVRPDDSNLVRWGRGELFTRDFGAALGRSQYRFCCTAHRAYSEAIPEIFRSAAGVFDGCNLFDRENVKEGTAFAGIGKGRKLPSLDFVDTVHRGFNTVERGFVNEIAALVDFLNREYACDEFNRIDLKVIRRIAETCVTGCRLPEPGPVEPDPTDRGFFSRLVRLARSEKGLSRDR